MFTSVLENSCQTADETVSPVITSTHSFATQEGKGIKRAVRTLNRFNKKHSPGAETVSPPVGTPIFMFFGAEGVTRPVNTFFDCGCSEAIFQQDIPGKELRGTLLSKGPFKMGGVGDSSVTAGDEWLVQFSREDGRKQLVKGVTMEKNYLRLPTC